MYSVFENINLEAFTENKITSEEDFNEIKIQLEKSFQTNEGQIFLSAKKEELDQDFDEIHKLYNKLSKTRSLKSISKLNGELSQKLNKFRIKYSEFITNDKLLQDTLELEILHEYGEKIITVVLIVKDVSKLANENPQNLELKKILDKYSKATENLLVAVEKCYSVITFKELESINAFVSELIKFSDKFIKSREKNTERYISIAKRINSTCKAILWELDKDKNTNTFTENKSWDLIIGEHPYEKLLKESKQRIHSLGED
ncbi:hypothetical protein Cylst_2177 [Cylindrospermum stagnale PCC 7417]|uniref:Uncharacterized protein n=1 Tax=Cylindrospermum stagnale PCC 7417 TaxID=56107 RepID=K9WW21_9NOST|nr:hypothetical protein [Cylindrospermum stagnale]AFZ24413.1 hypothetical protein Cylst_2177 [Cylindrospermum stagnale PCC 7417]